MMHLLLELLLGLGCRCMLHNCLPQNPGRAIALLKLNALVLMQAPQVMYPASLGQL